MVPQRESEFIKATGIAYRYFDSHSITTKAGVTLSNLNRWANPTGAVHKEASYSDNEQCNLSECHLMAVCVHVCDFSPCHCFICRMTIKDYEADIISLLKYVLYLSCMHFLMWVGGYFSARSALILPIPLPLQESKTS